MEANRWNSLFFQFLTSDALKKKSPKKRKVQNKSPKEKGSKSNTQSRIVLEKWQKPFPQNNSSCSGFFLAHQTSKMVKGQALKMRYFLCFCIKANIKKTHQRVGFSLVVCFLFEELYNLHFKNKVGFCWDSTPSLFSVCNAVGEEQRGFISYFQ